MRNEVCSKCDSTSQEMCLLIRKCPLWIDRPKMTIEDIKDRYKQEWIRKALTESEKGI